MIYSHIHTWFCLTLVFPNVKSIKLYLVILIYQSLIISEVEHLFHVQIFVSCSANSWLHFLIRAD